MVDDHNLGRTIRMFLVDGSASGIVTAEIINWTGKVVVAPRSRLPDLFRRDETNRTGIYILTGEDKEHSGRTLAYIGETDDIRSRLARHNVDDRMEFFNRVCLVVSKDENLNKAHVRFLESRLLQRARQAGRAKLVNVNDPGFDLLPESDKADMEFFLAQIELILPALGYDLFKRMSRVPVTSEERLAGEGPDADKGTAEGGISIFDLAPGKDAPVQRDRYRGASIEKPESLPEQTFELNAADVKARGYEVDGEFVVEAGSFARRDRDGVGWDGYRKVRDQLLDDGKLRPDRDGLFVFAEDVPLRSPSEAACIVLAQAANGRKQWKIVGTTRTYNDWLAERLREASGEAGR